MTSYTTRFLAYAKTQDQAPEQCKAGADFIAWIRAKVKEWRDLTGHKGHLLAHHHQQIDTWLMATVGEKA